MLLAERGADIRLFSTTGDPSFHIKSYIFLRRDGGTISSVAPLLTHTDGKTPSFEFTWHPSAYRSTWQ